MRLLIDTNVILDVLLQREPFCSDGTDVLKLAGRSDVNLFVSASSVTDIYYLARKKLNNRDRLKDVLKSLLEVVGIAAVSKEEIESALELNWKDFEDSVQYSVASLQRMDGIVTRNPSDFKDSDIRVWEPGELLQEMSK